MTASVQSCMLLKVISCPAKARSEVYNLGTQEYCTVIDSIGWICNYLDLTPAIEFTGGDRGWIQGIIRLSFLILRKFAIRVGRQLFQ